MPPGALARLVRLVPVPLVSGCVRAVCCLMLTWVTIWAHVVEAPPFRPLLNLLVLHLLAMECRCSRFWQQYLASEPWMMIMAGMW